MHLDTRLLYAQCKPALKNLIERCLETDPDRRYPDAQALLKALQMIKLEG